MDLDWNNAAAMFGLGDPRQPSHAGEVDDDNDDDFYGADAQAGVSTRPSASVDGLTFELDTQATVAPTSVGQEQKQQTPIPIQQHLTAEARAENQRRAEILRAKLLASRQSTPSSKANGPAGTPAARSKETPSESVPPGQQEAPAQTVKQQPQAGNMMVNNVEPPSGMSGVEALLNAGKAAADAQTAALAAQKTPHPKEPAQNNINGTSNIQNKHSKEGDKSVKAHSVPETPKNPTQNPTRPTNLSNTYYADLPAWLEITGYHDVEYRTSKLRTYRARIELEKEQVRIQEQLEKLRQEEQAQLSLRTGTPMQTTTMAPPPLPSTMPAEKAPPKANGLKREHSPGGLPAEKSRRRDDNSGFRIRGAMDSPDNSRPGTARQPQTPTPTESERRLSYPEERRRSFDEYNGSRSRDSSLERRQSYYRREGEAYDHYAPRQPSRKSSRGAFGGNNRNNSYPRQPQQPQYRGSAALDLRKGGVRYFMIKSWNHENVIAAQRENVWATQEKNEELLAKAFNTSRRVILLFSVNKSMAFQGYALMTSAPDPRMAKPSWASKLNWGTSAAFSLRWFSTTPIPFCLVGHLKNPLNLDENGEARAVLVGKDGQEIAPDAGMGVVWALDEAEIADAEPR
ncbi:Zinc finger CCCH domain-containing 45 [Lecanosticta acicola]|uniref:Zinc finger CCCH domain-containing 45 n=1 Tax=Lecanosticta acicola TaxID=111012 RepID=A0AAI8Z4P0_9PEZI|nr:Zinc finger CCCH domain-containing 45 [Lecanosticta acicola]